MPDALLDDRALVSVTGPEAEHFLQNIVTADLDRLAVGEAMPGALLNPQGKILFDFLILRDGENSLLLDCRADVADDFIRRLSFYRLRAKVEISKRNQAAVAIAWDADSAASGNASSASGTDSSRPPAESSVQPGDAAGVLDRRFHGLAVRRHYRQSPAAQDNAVAWHALRVEQGVAESGADYALGDAFPHDVLLDELGGIGFAKGCYVGQEVVSRMQHRGTARRRVLIVTGTDKLPESGTAIEAAGRAVGSLGTVSGAKGLAILRIDRVKDALDASAAITAGGVALDVAIPPFAKFTFPLDSVGSEGT